jgi:hypothetical protein
MRTWRWRSPRTTCSSSPARAAPEQPLPNLFFAAVHFLLLQDPAAPLGQFYPSLFSTAASPEAAYPAFRAFCLAHAAALQHLLARRRVQTNEVSRCAYLFPAFALVAQLAWLEWLDNGIRADA